MNPFDCTHCTPVTATSKSGPPIVAVRYCPAHRAESRDRLAAARAANPEVDAVHRMIEAARA